MSDHHYRPDREPTPLDLRELERIAERRAEVEAVEAGGDGRQAAVRTLLLATLHDMEEDLCLYGRRAPVVVEGWRRLAHYAWFGKEGGE